MNTVNFHNVLYSHKETESFLILYKSRLENVLIKRDNLKITCELGQGLFAACTYSATTTVSILIVHLTCRCLWDCLQRLDSRL